MQVAWAQQFLPAAADARAARARACLLWRRKLMGRAVQGWKVQARRCVCLRVCVSVCVIHQFGCNRIYEKLERFIDESIAQGCA